MKAFVIKNKDGEYLQFFDADSDDIGFTDDLTLAMLYDKNEKDIMKKAYSNMKWEYPEITMAEGNLEEENKVLKSNLYEIWHSFATICEVCVTESKKEISSENAVEEIRNYLTDIDLCFDEIKEKLGTDYFIKQAKEEK